MVIIPEPIVYSMDVEAMNTGKKTRVMVYSQGNRTESWLNPNLEYQNFSAGAPIDSLVITRKQAFNKKFQVDRITFYDYRTYELPLFASVNVNGIHEMKKRENYFFTADQSGTDGATIFWRWAELRDKVAISKWHWQQSQGFQEVFVPMTDGYYEFFISYPISSAKSTLRNVEISTGK